MQGRVLEALRPLTDGNVRLTGASRTDAGVHALGQVASVESPEPFPPATVMAALNARLPRDIRVLAARSVPGDFDARRSARLKRYGYLVTTERVASPFFRGFAWPLARAVDVRAMGRAAACLRGKHDFSAFCAAPGRDRDPVCTVRAVRVVSRGTRIGVVVSADAFLHHMVRNIVGTLVEVGLGRKPTGWVADVLAGRDRGAAGPTAPAEGLYLLRVRYSWSVFPGGRHRGNGGTALTIGR